MTMQCSMQKKIRLYEKVDISVQKATECMEVIDSVMSYLAEGRNLVSKVAAGENLGDLHKFSINLEAMSRIIADFKYGSFGRIVDNMQDLARFAEDGSI